MAASLKVIDGNMAISTDRQKALDAALAQIDRAFGKGSAMKLGSREAMEVEAISSACSPVSGCDTISSSMLTPSFLA